MSRGDFQPFKQCVLVSFPNPLATEVRWVYPGYNLTISVVSAVGKGGLTLLLTASIVLQSGGSPLVGPTHPEKTSLEYVGILKANSNKSQNTIKVIFQA